MAFDLLTHLKELCARPGLPGHETPVAEYLRAEWAPFTESQQVHPLGSLWAVRPGQGAAPRPRVMLAAHLDAIGLMVTRREGEFLRVTSLGGVDARVMPGQLVTVHGRADLPGVVALPPAHLLPRNLREQAPPVTELLVDTGLPAERLGQIVEVGDLVSFAQTPTELLNGLLAANRLDNRASLAAITVCLRELQGRAHAWDVIAAAPAQEEISYQGGSTLGYTLRPDLAVAVDVTFGRDANTRDAGFRTFPLGGGPVLGLGPNIHAGLLAALQAAAQRAEIPHAVEPMWGHSGTDAYALQVAREGIPTAVVSIPLRNMHTPVEIVSLSDIIRAGRLLAEFCAGLGEDFLAGLGLDQS